MSSIHCHYSGDLHCQAQHLASGAQLSTDAPPDHAGRGEGFHQLVPQLDESLFSEQKQK